ncbi:hypothetical protein [Phytohabitans suffuscus]|uniref:Uncharacterized protein n=1 Tax=Phytohabitans suffuscus TaxID=624315 RepID=A0A6F8YX87_9ACTN|nr:hypothetical protein [Phytohabitans suffuscus]BCB90712.1 hypothetical protein Psuf_080250 [Phytohabitans suffuscus]
MDDADAGYRAVFDRLFERGALAVRTGAHHRDTPPADGGRWGMSVVFPPDPAATRRLAAVTAEAMALAGPGHWPTGAPGAVHFTVRAMEAHRSAVPPGDPLAVRCAAALGRAAAASRPVRLRLGGLTLTPSGVMACAYPVDGAAGEFAGRLGAELGDDGWFEAGFHRDVWYATLVHFTGGIRDAEGLVDWVAARRDLDLGTVPVDVAELLRFAYDGRQPVRVTLARAQLSGVAGLRA